MLYPSIDKILTKVESKYLLVHVISQRSKQMLEYNHFQMKEDVKGSNPLFSTNKKIIPF